jgi:hypothetical protein
MTIEMFNFWYFFWIIISAGGIVGLYFGLKNKTLRTQKIVLFSFLAFGVIAHFLKCFIPPYSVDNARLLRDSWFINICGANIAVFPFIFLSKSKKAKDYMFYIGVLSGALAIFYPQEPLGETARSLEILETVRFYYHHWMLLAVPLLMVLLKVHTLSWKRILYAPVGVMLLMLFIILNQFFQAELGFISVRGSQGFDYVISEDYWSAFKEVNWKNSSYIYGPDFPDVIGKIFAVFCPKFFTKVPVGPYKGQEKYWPWFWMIFPVFIIFTPLAFGLCMIFDSKNFKADMKTYYGKVKEFFAKLKNKKTEK